MEPWPRSICAARPARVAPWPRSICAARPARVAPSPRSICAARPARVAPWPRSICAARWRHGHEAYAPPPAAAETADAPPLAWCLVPADAHCNCHALYRLVRYICPSLEGPDLLLFGTRLPRALWDSNAPQDVVGLLRQWLSHAARAWCLCCSRTKTTLPASGSTSRTWCGPQRLLALCARLSPEALHRNDAKKRAQSAHRPLHARRFAAQEKEEARSERAPRLGQTLVGLLFIAHGGSRRGAHSRRRALQKAPRARH